MPQSFQTISHKNIAKGMDTRSSLNSIQEGYAELARNMNTNSNGFVEKRKGYQGYYGDIPLRLHSTEVVGSNLHLTFDSSYDFTGVSPKPLVGYGTHDISLIRTEGLEVYWPTFINPIFSTPIIGDNSEDNSSGTIDNLIGIAQEITSTTTNSIALANESKMTTSTITHNISIDDNDLAYYTADLTTGVGTYFTEFSNAAPVVEGESSTFSFNTGDHNLENLNIVPQLFKVSGSEYTLIQADSIEVTDLGTISIVIDNQDAGTNTYKLSIFDVDGTHAIHSTSTSYTFTDVDSPFNFVSILARGAGGLFYATPDEAVYDYIARTLTITLDDITGLTDITYIYTEGTNPSNVLVVTKPSNWTDTTDPEFVVYGISQAELVSNTGGETVSLEEYSTVGVADLIVSMNGNFYTDRTGILSTPITKIDISSRTDGLQTLGPFFGARGIVANNVSNGNAIIESIDNLRNGTFRVNLDLGTISSGTFALLNNEDQLTIKQSGNKLYNGTFKIIDYNESSLVLENPSLGPTVPAETDVDGTATINMDSILMLDSSGYSVGDKIESSLFSTPPTILAVDGNTIYMDNISSDSVISGASKFSVTRITDQLPLEDHEYFLVGDMIEVENYTRLFRVVSVDITSGTITIDESIEISSAETRSNYVTLQGRWFPIEAPEQNSPIIQHVDEDAPDEQPRIRAAAISDSLFFSNYNDEVMKYDGDSVYQAGIVPWNPVAHSWLDDENAGIVVNSNTAIDVQDDGTNTTFTFASADSMPEYDNEYYIHGKYSLVKLTEGFASTVSHDTTSKTIVVSGSLITFKLNSASYATETGFPASTNAIAVTLANDPNDDLLELSAGDVISLAGGISPSIATVVSSGQVGGWHVVTVEEAGNYNSAGSGTITGQLGNTKELSSGTMSIPETFSYYFKIQAVDRNGNLIASAVTNSTDSVVKINKSGTVVHKLIGMPKFGNYDYDRLDLMVYRTKSGTSAPFYEIRRYPIDYENSESIIFITDGTADLSLPDDPDDTISISIKGAELPLSSREPPRSKYVESVNSRLIQGNVRGYNELDLVFRSEFGIELDNVLAPKLGDDTNVTITNGTDSQEFRFKPTVSSVNGSLMNEVHEVSSISVLGEDVTITVDSGDGTAWDGSYIGRWIQVDSFLVADDGTTGSPITYLTAENKKPNAGKLIGWAKITAVNTINQLVIKIPNLNMTGYIQGDEPLYILTSFGDYIPVMAHPYITNATTGDYSITELVYRDTTAALDFTSAVIRGAIDLSKAFNYYQATESKPWAYARAGGTQGAGRLLVTSSNPNDILSSTISYSTSDSVDLQVFVNDIVVANGGTASGQTPTFPSRLIYSSQNFPEIMDNPYAFSAVSSDSIIDVNADDGEEITGMSSFFAISAGGASQVEDTLIVFKTSSVYSVNVSTGRVSRMESQGQGCTMPDSVEPTSDGIMFANESGIYVVTPNLQVSYIGMPLEGYWKTLNRDDLTSAFGFLDSESRKYKLSVPVKGSTQNSQVAVYDYIREEGDGAWTQHDNISASAWEQRGVDIVFGNYGGRVYKIRDEGDSTDYRDDASGISATFTYAPQDFGDSGTRKDVGRIETHFGGETSGTSIEISTSTDMSRTFNQLDTTSFTGIDKKLYTLGSSITDKHCVFLQVKYDHNTKDENLKIVGIDYKVKILEELGIDQTSE